MAWGYDDEGEAGTGTIEWYVHFPEHIAPKIRILEAAAGGSNGAALTVHHRVFTWGECEDGAIGNGFSCGEGRADPTPRFICDHVSQLAAGFDHTVVLRLPGSTAGGCRARITNPQD